MKIRVEGLTESPVALSAREAIADYPALSEMQDGEECVFLEPLQLDLTVAKEYDHIRVEGRVATRVRLTCSRCLEEFEKDLVSSFTVFYATTTLVAEDEEVSLTEKDLVTVSYDGETIDFTHEIEEQVLLELPYKALCKEECKGLCVKCGADLNLGDCGCDRSGAGFAFSALKDFTVKQ